MATKTKSAYVTGATVNRAGVKVKTLPENVDKTVAELCASLENSGGKVLDVKTEIAFSNAAGDAAFVQVTYEGGKEEPKVKK